MTDPAVEAATRAMQATYGYSEPVRTMMVPAAREALKPIREWFDKAKARAEEGELYDQIDLLEELAPLIYSESELTDD